MLENRIWKWYRKHNDAIYAVLDIACDVVPGGKVIMYTLKGVHALLCDLQEGEDEIIGEEQKEKIEKIEVLLTQIKPVLIDIVEEIEDMESFKHAGDLRSARKAIEEGKLWPEVQKIVPELNDSICRSVSSLKKNKVLNSKYELQAKIGSGGQGEVYKAFHRVANRTVAVKLLPPEFSGNETAIENLRQEYQYLVERLVCEHIVQYREMDFDPAENRYFLVMDYVEGKNLRKIMLERRKQPMPLEEALKLLTPVSLSLDFAHKKKIVHRDLKPENILICNTDGRVLLTDFGLASEIHTSLSCKLSSSVDISGTLPYMAPEQYRGRSTDEKTDIWALGIILYELLSGFHPFQGMDFNHYKELICNEHPEPIQTLSDYHWNALSRMLQKEKKDRPNSAQDALGSFKKEEDAIALAKNFLGECKNSLLAVGKEVAANISKPPQTKRISDSTPGSIVATDISRAKATMAKQEKPKTDENVAKKPEMPKKQIEEKAMVTKVRKSEQEDISGFTFLRSATYTCGKIQKTVSEYRHETTGMEFVKIPEDAENSSFLMGKYPVTQEMWQKIMGNNPSHFKGMVCPVECVSWNDCIEFCNITGLHLPTEKQWEHACRGKHNGIYCFGDDESLLKEYSWYNENSDDRTHPIGQKMPNAYGLYDMHGNVSEWCKNYHRDVMGGKLYPRRGGSYRNLASDCCSYAWRESAPFTGLRDIGFRCCYNLGKREHIEKKGKISGNTSATDTEPGIKELKFLLIMEKAQRAEVHSMWETAANLYKEALSYKPGDAVAFSLMKKNQQRFAKRKKTAIVFAIVFPIIVIIVSVILFFVIGLILAIIGK